MIDDAADSQDGQTPQTAKLALEDGSVFTGTSFGAALLAGELTETSPEAPIRMAREVGAMRSYARQWFALAADRVN